MMTKILVIEDKQDNLDLITYLLKAFGYEVLTAKSGEAGLACIRQQQLDIVLLDIHMPGMDGYEVARHIRKELVPTILIAVTALAMVGDRDKIMNAGFDGYISKPIEAEIFIQQIAAFLPPEKRIVSPCSTFATSSPEKSTVSVQSAYATKTILVVDNLPMNLHIVSSTLEPLGYKVICVDNVDQALAASKNHALNLILMDVNMPEKNGWELIKIVRSVDHPLKDTPIVVLSCSREDIYAIQKYPNVHYLTRPVEPQKLVDQVEIVLKSFGGN